MKVTESLVRRMGYPLWLTYKRETAILDGVKRFAPLWNADQTKLEALRLASLRALLSHAGRHSPFYRQRFKEAGFDSVTINRPTDVAVLPFITKADLNNDIDQVLSQRLRREDLVRSSTGGSSGQTLTFYRDKAVTAIRRSQDMLFNQKIGVYPGSKRAWVWGSPLDQIDPGTLKSKVRNFLTERAIYFYSFTADRESIHEFVKLLNAHRPEVIFAYPNMLAVIAEYVLETGFQTRPIGKVVVTAEAVYDWQRKLFQKAFGATTFERYGAREIGTLAAEVPGHSGLHVFEPTYYIEVVDEAGHPVPEGTMGELIVTDLFNYAMPLIRYRTGDMVVLDSTPCPCGSTWRRIAKVGGRVLDLVTRPDSSRIAGQVIPMLLRTVGMRNRVQIVQTAVNHFMVRHLTPETISGNKREQLQAAFRRLLGPEVTLSYEGVPQLTYDKSGKYPWFINQLNQKRLDGSQERRD